MASLCDGNTLKKRIRVFKSKGTEMEDPLDEWRRVHHHRGTDTCTSLCTKPTTGECAHCEALAEAKRFWRRSGLGLVERVLTWAAGIGWLWLCDAWRYLTGPTGYRGIIGVVATLVGAYVGLYAIMEARYDRGFSRAAYQQSTFINLVTSGNRGSFIAAMKTFGPIQMMEVSKEPKPWPLFADWWAKPERPNEGPLHTWALYFFPLCTPQLCGRPNPKDSENPDTGIRIALDRANLERANLNGVRLYRASLR
jgi:hypothetical protein